MTRQPAIRLLNEVRFLPVAVSEPLEMLMTRMSEPRCPSLHPWPNPIGLGVVLLALTGCTTVRYVETFEPEGVVERVIVRSDVGTVELLPGDGLRVERAIRAPEGALTLSHVVQDGTLTLEARCRALLPCAVDVQVVVPEGTPVDVELGHGEVWATGLSAALDVQIGDGDADLDLLGPLAARVGSGEVRASLPGDASARIAVGSGDIEVVVPPGRYTLDLSAADTLVSGIDDVEGASAVLELLAPAGRATVTGVERVASLR